MKPTRLLSIVLVCCSTLVTAQQASTSALRQGPGVRALDDAREPAVLATCKHPPQPAAVRSPTTPPAAREYAVTAIPDVIEAGQRWQPIWTAEGSVADGIIAADDGGILIPRAQKSDVIKLTAQGKVTVLYRDTNTGGALSRSKHGALFVAERGLNPAIWQLAPKRNVLANRYQGEVLDCLGSGLNDLMADSRGGVYFTMGGLYYANPHGAVTKYGDDLHTNGLILSPDEKTLYVTNGDGLVAFDVQADGSLTHQREFVSLPDGYGDGSAVDKDGRLYVTGGSAGVRVVAPDGKYLGTIPTPLGIMSVTFGGPERKTLFAVMSGVFEGHKGVQVIAIPMVAQGYAGRAK